MKHIRVIVLVVLLAVVGGVLAFQLLSKNNNPTSDANVTAVGLSPDRTVVWAKVSDYYSHSCTEVHLELDKRGNQWGVRVIVEEVSKFCTMELGIDSPVSTLPSGDLKVPDGEVGTPSAYVYALHLDEPVPGDVTLVANP